MMRKTSLVLVSLVCLLSTAFAGTIRHDRPPEIYTTLGQNPAFDSVGRFFASGSSGSFIASGTLIAPDVVLTAGHVLDNATSLDFTIGGNTYSGDIWGAHPGWTPGDITGAILGYDIALVHLNTPVPDVVPATLYGGNHELHRTGIIAGFGATGTGLTGDTTFDGQKRVGFNKIDAFLYESESRVFLTDFDNPDNRNDSILGSRKPHPLEYMIAPGDSGGPVFLTGRGGLAVAGVHSFVLALDGNADSDYGDISGHTRVSMFNDWIDEGIASFLSLADADLYSINPDSTPFGFLNIATVPEPATLLLLGLGTFVLRRKRRA